MIHTENHNSLGLTGSKKERSSSGALSTSTFPYLSCKKSLVAQWRTPLQQCWWNQSPGKPLLNVLIKVHGEERGRKWGSQTFAKLLSTSCNQCFVRAPDIWVGRSTGKSSPQQTNVEFLNLQWRDKILWVQLSPNFCCTLLTWGFTGGWVPWACRIWRKHSHIRKTAGELSCYLILLQYLSISMCHLNLPWKKNMTKNFKHFESLGCW